jgi:peptidoglycan/xylan/chitin deacetylase (PgdA/CDA1 family)
MNGRLVAGGTVAVVGMIAGIGACSTSLESTDSDAGAPFEVTLPSGGQCAPRVAQADLSPAAATACSPLADGGVDSGSGPARPLGVGYPDGADPLPAHVAYLTFDDGPSDWTNDFLDMLKARGVAATFFVTAKQLKGPAGLNGTYVDEYGHEWAYRDLVRREIDEGHQVGNHTVDHPDLGAIASEQIQSELDENELLINVALVRAGSLPRVLSLFRPPFGAPWYTDLANVADPSAARAAAGPRIAMHGLNVMWNIDSTDSAEWAVGESFSRTAGAVVPDAGAPSYADKVTRIKTTVLQDPKIARGDGIIVLMHDTHDTTRDALSDIIAGLASAGYRFDTIENYAQARWARPSRDLTPGPSLYSPCVDDRNWGCQSFGVPVGTDRAREVCGRMWRAYQALGGSTAVGAPTAAPVQAAATGILAQSFEKGVIELHPENPPPCDVVFVPQ